MLSALVWYGRLPTILVTLRSILHVIWYSESLGKTRPKTEKYTTRRALEYCCNQEVPDRMDV